MNLPLMLAVYLRANVKLSFPLHDWTEWMKVELQRLLSTVATIYKLQNVLI